jgi:hypothetical protein
VVNGRKAAAQGYSARGQKAGNSPAKKKHSLSGAVLVEQAFSNGSARIRSAVNI